MPPESTRKLHIVYRKLILEKVPFFLLAAAGCVATLLAQNKAIYSFSDLPLPLRMANALVSCVVYLGQMVWPAGLSALYLFPIHGIPLWEVAMAGALLAVISAVIFRQRRKQPWMLVGWVWYLVMLAPVMGVIQVGLQAHADRYTYLPHIGIYIAVTWLIAEWAAKRRMGQAASGCLMAGVVGVLMVCAWNQAAYWKSSETVWSHAVACNTRNYVAHFNLGVVLVHKGKVDEAIGHFEQALRSEPGYVNAHFNLGAALLQKGRVDEAIGHFEQALQSDPDHVDFLTSLGAALLQKGRVDEAIGHYQEALRLDANSAEACFGLGDAYSRKGRMAEAINQYQKALQIKPAYPEALNNLAWLLAGCPDASLRDGKKAVELARKANDLTGSANPVILHTLAAALAEAGRFDDATQCVQKAIEVAPAAGRQDLIGPLNDELGRYKAGHPSYQ